jgi:hypothetical protein
VESLPGITFNIIFFITFLLLLIVGCCCSTSVVVEFVLAKKEDIRKQSLCVKYFFMTLLEKHNSIK